MSRMLFSAIAVMSLFSGARTQRETVPAATTFRLDSVDGIEMVDGKAEVAEYLGRKAFRLAPLPGRDGGDDSGLAIIKATNFKDGVIEADIAGSPRPGAPADSRGFIGIAFRVQPHGSHYECFYLRPTNGRAEDQLRRNHSAQYVSAPDYPWFRLRNENPGVFESYVDLESGAWTRIKIVVAGTRARLYINDASQPALIVNDLKLGEVSGQIALWAHWTTDGYFSNLTVQ